MAQVTITVSTSYFAAADPTVDHRRDALEMRLSIDHQTGFRYATRVKSSYNDARMTPAETDHQTVWSSRITIEPAAGASTTPTTGAPLPPPSRCTSRTTGSACMHKRRRNPWR